MAGYAGPVRLAHADSHARIGPGTGSPRRPRATASAAAGSEEREELEDSLLAPGATRASGAGRRAQPEPPDAWRTCFERDRDRILHATSFRRLAGKTQVFVFPQDHQRTRLTHALEVAQVATAIARACRLNVALTEAIALGHDCGHGPGGHASEDALDPYVPGGFDHAPWGAQVSLAPLNLCAETVDGIANHSWSRPGAVDTRRRGGQLGRPDRVRLPRLGGRRALGHRGPAPAAGGRPHGVRRTAQRPAGRVHHRRRSRPPCARGRSAWRKRRRRRSRRSGPATTSASTSATRRCARARR